MENLNEKNVKVTERARYEEMAQIFAKMDKTDLVEFCNHKLEQIAKKADKRKTQATDTQKANEELSKLVYAELSKYPEGITSNDLLHGSVELSQKVKSSQKLVYLFKILMEENKVINIKDKRKSLYKVVTAESVEDEE